MADLVARTALAGRAFAAGRFSLAEGGAEPGLAFIEVAGDGALDLLAISAMAPGSAGTVTTRLAALRVTIDWQRGPAETARIAVERFSADYLWTWLEARIRIETSA